MKEIVNATIKYSPKGQNNDSDVALQETGNDTYNGKFGLVAHLRCHTDPNIFIVQENSIKPLTHRAVSAGQPSSRPRRNSASMKIASKATETKRPNTRQREDCPHSVQFHDLCAMCGKDLTANKVLEEVYSSKMKPRSQKAPTALSNDQYGEVSEDSVQDSQDRIFMGHGGGPVSVTREVPDFHPAMMKSDDVKGSS